MYQWYIVDSEGTIVDIVLSHYRPTLVTNGYKVVIEDELTLEQLSAYKHWEKRS